MSHCMERVEIESISPEHQVLNVEEDTQQKPNMLQNMAWLAENEVYLIKFLPISLLRVKEHFSHKGLLFSPKNC